MILERFELGTIRTNCYLLYDDILKKGLIVDPGFESENLITHIKNLGVDIEYILLTHAHFDHISGVQFVKDSFPGAKIIANEIEKELFLSPDLNLTKRWGSKGIVLENISYLKDNEEIDFLGNKIKMLATPGHTQGSCSFFVESEKILFAGDTLFRLSIGRCDFPTGNETDLLNSVIEKIFILDDETKVLPGHGVPSTIGFEKQNNPYFK